MKRSKKKLARLMSRNLTASSMQRAMICPGFTVLPHKEYRTKNAVRSANRGTRIHTFMERVTNGFSFREASLGLGDDIYEVCTKLYETKSDWILGPGTKAEGAYALNLMTGEARLLGYSINREYGDLGEDEIAGTIDAELVTGNVIHIRDFKTGKWPVPLPKNNWQLQSLMVAVAKVHNCTHAISDICYVNTNGTVSIDEPFEVDQLELDILEDLLRENCTQRKQAKAIYQVTNSPNPHFSSMFLRTGKQCKFCPAQSACPKKG